MIDKMIAEQLANPQQGYVEMAGFQLKIDYCVLQGEKSKLVRPKRNPIVLVTGFGSGWTGIAELGYYLAVRGWEVCLVSLPGYGNSDNPPGIFGEGEDFLGEAFTLSRFAEEVFANSKIHWIGHSMGSAIIMKLACEVPVIVASLTMLNPAGFEKIKSKLWLVAKFVISGMLHRLSFSGESAMKEMKKILPREKSPFMFSRLSQRISEIRRICSGYATKEFLRHYDLFKRIPLFYISSERDFVVPARKSELIKFDSLKRIFNEVIILPKLWHNTTMFGSEATAKTIHRLLK